MKKYYLFLCGLLAFLLFSCAIGKEEELLDAMPDLAASLSGSS